MGIKPTGGDLPSLSLDTRQELADDLRVSTDEIGTRVGQVQSEIYATAQSANTSAGELAGRVKALEDRATVSKDSEGRIQAADPSEPGDVATKRYVDQAIDGLDVPQPQPQPQPPRAVFTGTGSTAASGWSTWEQRATADSVELREINTRMTVLEDGLYLVTFVSPKSTLTRALHTASPVRSAVSLSGGVFAEVVAAKAGDQVRVVGSQPDLTVIIDRLDP